MLFAFFRLLPFTVCLFWTAVMVLDWRRNNGAQRLLTAFMGTSALLYLCHAVFFSHEPDCRNLSECVYAFCNIGVFPLYGLYIYRLTLWPRLRWSHLIILLPALAIGLWATTLHLFFPGDTSAESLRILVMRIVFLVQLVPICVMCYRRLNTFDNEIANYYADTDTRKVTPIRRLMLLLLFGAFISAIANFLGREYFDTAEWMLCVPSLLFSALLFGVGYVGMRQTFCINDLMRDEGIAAYAVDEAPMEAAVNEAFTPPSPSDADSNEELSHLISRLSNLMAESQIYLQHDLRLSKVASMLGVGRTTLSRRINQELNLSFSDYINVLRIDHACTLLADPRSSKLALSGVAEMSGFSSDSSFYRAFRRHMGMTPKQFMESRLK